MDEENVKKSYKEKKAEYNKRYQEKRKALLEQIKAESMEPPAPILKPQPSPTMDESSDDSFFFQPTTTKPQLKKKQKPTPVVIVQEERPLKEKITEGLTNLLITSVISAIPLIARAVLAQRPQKPLNVSETKSDIMEFQ